MQERVYDFVSCVWSNFQKRKTGSNLLRSQHHVLEDLSHSDKFLIGLADKNLGPVIIEKDRYIQVVFANHLLDKDTYLRMTEEEANKKVNKVKLALQSFTKTHKYLLSKSDRTFLS